MWRGLVLKFDPFKRNITRFYHHYKPKDRVFAPDSSVSEQYAIKDILLFRYEAPKKILKINAGAVALLSMFSYMSYSAWQLKNDLSPYEENFYKTEKGKEKEWIFRTFLSANRVVSLGYGIFGVCVSFYWLLRTSNTVRRVVLRKGGKHVTIVTYGLFGVTSRHSTVPINQVSMFS